MYANIYQSYGSIYMVKLPKVTCIDPIYLSAPRDPVSHLWHIYGAPDLERSWIHLLLFLGRDTVWNVTLVGAFQRWNWFNLCTVSIYKKWNCFDMICQCEQWHILKRPYVFIPNISDIYLPRFAILIANYVRSWMYYTNMCSKRKHVSQYTLHLPRYQLISSPQNESL